MAYKDNSDQDGCCKKVAPVTKPISVGGAKPLEYIGSEYSCDIQTKQK
jgi:hypothetical protein